MSLFDESVAAVAKVVAGARGELDVSEGAFDVHAKTYAVESAGLDSFIILVVCERPRRGHGLLDLLLPKGELLCLALRKRRPSLFDVAHHGKLLASGHLVRRIIEYPDTLLHVTRAPVVLIAVAELAWFLELFPLDAWITLNVVHMARVQVPSQFHLEKGPSVW